LERAWPLFLGAFVVTAILLGGTSEPALLPALILRAFSIVIIAIGLIRIGFTAPNRMSAEAFAIMLGAVGLVLLQLVPLPPFLWMSLPGREFVVEGIRASGIEPGWMPLTLSPPATQLAFLALLVPIAAFVASLSLNSTGRWLLVAVILACILASILLGLAQKFQGSAGILYFYDETNRGWATGTFANRNFFAALLYCSIPLTWALALRYSRERRFNTYVIGAFAAVMLLAVILGLAAAGSRAGIILAMIALIASASLGTSGSGSPAKSQTRWAIIAVVVGLLLIGQFGMVAILRLAELDPVTDYRTVISETTLRAAWDYFPFGSGFGTFVPVYAMHETPNTILSAYVNHAHNDWAELWLEGSIPAALLLLAFLAWYGLTIYRLWRARQESHDGLLIQRAGTIVCGLLLLHSIVDYPLREPALTVIFGLMCGFMTALPSRLGATEAFSRSRPHKTARHRTHAARDERGRR